MESSVGSIVWFIGLHSCRGLLDLEHYGLVAAANALGLSSPSMGHFLASVKEQVAKEQVEIRKKREVDKVPALRDSTGCSNLFKVPSGPA